MEKYTKDEVPQQAGLQVAAVFKSINLMSVGVATLLSTGMVLDRHSVTVSVLSGVGFYGAIAGLLILWQPGALPFVLVNRQHEVTERRRDQLQFKAQMAFAPTPRMNVVDPVQLVSTPPAILTEGKRFVPAVPGADARLKLSCVEFVTTLFDDNGSPNPRRILAAHTRRPGQVQAGKPKPEVLDYLTALQMVSEGDGGMLFFDVELYPTLREAINAIKRGYLAGAGGYPPFDPSLSSPATREGDM